MEFISNLNVTHEDVIIRLFVSSLEGDARTWVKMCKSSKEMSSFAGLIQVFLKYWDPTYEEEDQKEGKNNADFEEELEEDSIEDEVPQESIENQVHQEHAYEKGDKASMPSYHEDKHLVRNGPLRISEYSDIFLKDLKKDYSEKINPCKMIYF